MLNYESKPDDKLKELKMPAGTETRREGIAVIDVDPNSDNYGKILIDIPLPPDLVAHHIFFITVMRPRPMLQLWVSLSYALLI